MPSDPPVPRFRPDHALNHLYVMRTPDREVFIVFEQCFRELKFFVPFLEVRQNLEHRPRALAISLFLLRGIIIGGTKRRLEPATLE